MNDSTPSGSTVLVVDSKPLSLLATAGVLHHAGMRCVCARTTQAVLQACGLKAPAAEEPAAGGPTPDNDSPRSTTLLRVDKPVGESSGADASLDAPRPEGIDLIVWDVGDDVIAVLETLAEIRQRHPELPVVLLASSRWAGLEKKTETLNASTRCLFQPIDPESLIAVCEPLLWMPALQSMHRQRGCRPNRPGWVTL